MKNESPIGELIQTNSKKFKQFLSVNIIYNIDCECFFFFLTC